MELDDIELDDGLKQKIAERYSQQLQKDLEAQTTGLKSKVDELLSEKKKVQREREEAQRQAELAAEKNAKSDNDWKQLFESQKSRADSLEREKQEMMSNIEKAKISAESGKIAASLTKDAQRAQLLQQQINQRLTLVEGEIKVTDENGQLTVSTVDDLVSSIKSKYDFLVDGISASGGGAARSDGSAKDRKTEISRADFDAMSQGQRAQFVKSGGKVFND